MSGPRISPATLVRISLLAATVAALACLWAAWCWFPAFAWNDVRLAPAFALRHGLNPYPPLGGGPLNTWTYGPVGFILNLPATFATSAAGALQLAWLINALTLLGPLVVIFFGSAELRAQGSAARWFALTLAVLLLPHQMLLLQVPDHAAIAFGLLSCWCLAGRARPTAARLAAAAALCALAISAKQIAVFLVAGQLAYLLLDRAWATAVRYSAWLAGWNALALALSVWAFGFDNFWLNVVEIPHRSPGVAVAARLAARALPLLAQVALPAAGLIVLWLSRRWPAGDRESVRFFRLTVLAAAALLPIGFLAFRKNGGDMNLFHSWNYLLPGGLLVWLAAKGASAGAGRALLAATALAVASRGTDLASLPAHPHTEHFDVAAQLTAAYPHALWFPQNPVLAFYAGGELWHSEDGILARNVCGYGLREIDFRRYLPSHLDGVVYPATAEFSVMMSLLPEFNHRIALPYWTLLTRVPPPAARP